MALGWKRVKVTFDIHETLAGFLEQENDNGILVNVMEAGESKTGFYFIPWHAIISIFNVDSKKELAKRAKADAAKTTTKKELWDEDDGPG